MTDGHRPITAQHSSHVTSCSQSEASIYHDGHRSRKHRLSFNRADSQDQTYSDEDLMMGTWDESDDTQYVSNISHQLSTLSIPSRYNANDPPKKKIKRRKSRKVKRVRVKSAIQVTTSPRNQNTSDDTVAEAMSTGEDTDSSMSLGAVTDTGGAEADDELSCWEGPSRGYSSGEERHTVQHNTGPFLHNMNTNLPEVKVKREKLKTRHKPVHKECGGSSTSSPSMIDKLAKHMIAHDQSQHSNHGNNQSQHSKHMIAQEQPGPSGLNRRFS